MNQNTPSRLDGGDEKKQITDWLIDRVVMAPLNEQEDQTLQNACRGISKDAAAEAIRLLSAAQGGSRDSAARQCNHSRLYFAERCMRRPNRSPSAPVARQSSAKLDADLRVAAEAAQLDRVKQLLQQKANVCSVDTLDRTALHLACDHGWLAVATVLLDHRADVNQRDCFGKTPLVAAARRKLSLGGPINSALTVKLLLERNADVNAAPTRGEYAGKTALDIASENRNAAIVKLLSDCANRGDSKTESKTNSLPSERKSSVIVVKLLDKAYGFQPRDSGLCLSVDLFLLSAQLAMGETMDFCSCDTVAGASAIELSRQMASAKSRPSGIPLKFPAGADAGWQRRKAALIRSPGRPAAELKLVS